MSDLKTILISGNSVYIGAVLVRKLLKAEHKVKALKSYIYRDDIFLGVDDLWMISNVNLTDLDDDFYDTEKLKGIISGCNVVVYCDESPGGHNDKLAFDAFISQVDIAKADDVERFIYVSNGNTQFIEYLKNAASDKFTVNIVDASVINGNPLDKNLQVPVIFFNNKESYKQMITLYGRKQKDRKPHLDLPDTWYKNNGCNDLSFFTGIADICLSLAVMPLEKIQKKSWANTITRKIFLDRFYITQKFYKFLKKPYVPVVGRLKFLYDVVKHLFNVLLMLFNFHFWPEQTYRFSTRKLLPNKQMRYPANDRPNFPYKLIESKTSDISRMKEINVVLRGPSFNIERLEELSGPIFLVSFWESVNTKKDVVYVLSRPKGALRLAKLGLNVICPEVYITDYNGNVSSTNNEFDSLWYKQSMEDGTLKRIAICENIYNSPVPPYSSWVPTCSGLPAICALSYFAEKVNIYGWDFYLDSSPEAMTYWQLFFNLYKFKIDIARSFNHVEISIINYYYGYYLSTLPQFNVYGYVGQLGKQEKFVGKLERVLFNV